MKSSKAKQATNVKASDGSAPGAEAVLPAEGSRLHWQRTGSTWSADSHKATKAGDRDWYEVHPDTQGNYFSIFHQGTSPRVAVFYNPALLPTQAQAEAACERHHAWRMQGNREGRWEEEPIAVSQATLEKLLRKRLVHHATRLLVYGVSAAVVVCGPDWHGKTQSSENLLLAGYLIVGPLLLITTFCYLGQAAYTALLWLVALARCYVTRRATRRADR